MMHTTCKCQDHRIPGSREEDFLRFLYCKNVTAILVM